LLVEVLSPSTEDYDCGEKLEHYRQIASLDEVILVHHRKHKIVVWRRTGAHWSSIEHTDGAVSLAIGCDLPIAAVYRNPLEQLRG
jgi:Uma2 family endonuclease